MKRSHDSKRLRPSPVSDTHNGLVYQQKLLMLCLVQGLNNRLSFTIQTEGPEAGLFNDLVFKYKNNKGIRLLQAQHNADGKEKINKSYLTNPSSKKFNLCKHFQSYRRIKQNNSYSDLTIEHLIFATNMEMDEEVSESFEPVKNEKLIQLLRLDIEDVTEDHADDTEITLAQRLRFVNESVLSGEFDKFKCYKLLQKSNFRDGLIEKLDESSTSPNGSKKEEEAEEFLNLLTFVITPHELKLNEIIKTELSLMNDIHSVENAYSRLLVEMQDLLKLSISEEYSSFSGKQFFEKLKQERSLSYVWFDVQHLEETDLGLQESLRQHELIRKQWLGGQTLMITGLKGVGKTLATLLFVQIHCEYFNNNVVWMNAEDSNALKGSIQRLYDYLKYAMPGKPKLENMTIRTTIRSIYKFLSQREKVFFVFDNAESYDSVAEFIPNREDKTFFTVITTRDVKDIEGVETLNL